LKTNRGVVVVCKFKSLTWDLLQDFLRLKHYPQILQMFTLFFCVQASLARYTTVSKDFINLANEQPLPKFVQEQ
jgi:hypothetical protein